jgi:hypothetical protein
LDIKKALTVELALSCLSVAVFAHGPLALTIWHAPLTVAQGYTAVALVAVTIRLRRCKDTRLWGTRTLFHCEQLGTQCADLLLVLLTNLAMLLLEVIKTLPDGVQLIDLGVDCGLVFFALGTGHCELVCEGVKLLLDEVKGVLEARGVIWVWGCPRRSQGPMLDGSQ